MDIPSSGAIFTLGKSHLAENTQSYFYIKNDPVKRLISGPHQSAVICESGRLFVWGENQYGQLGIGGHSNNNSNKNNNNNTSNGNNGDIVTKPTCVKALKTLGLKIGDAAFGQNWAVMLTHSNEVFFTGRNIFPDETHVAQHFSRTQVEDDECAIIRKPFRLEEYDDYLPKSEETDNFVAVQAGHQHFAVLTTTGRLIGCGSNAQQQLGDLEADYDGHPVEIRLDASVQQFACGPESTLVLTASGNLFLTGRLNEFVFPRFTELQKNLSQTEQIIFLHISQSSEIYIVTNVGNIYRSHESVRNKSLVFQRFYDYDSEEHGPIWKLLRGFSFYAVLTKANKFYTTFSESGHHLKTFREISKFKNLRLLDIAVGDQHILVQGIPRSSTLSSATVGPNGEHRFMSRSRPMELNGNGAGTGTAERVSSGRSLTKQTMVEEDKVEAVEDKAEAVEVNGNVEEETLLAKEKAKMEESPMELKDLNMEKLSEQALKVDQVEAAKEVELEQVKPTAPIPTPELEPEPESLPAMPSPPAQSPTDSIKSRAIRFEAEQKEDHSPNRDMEQLRPRTPYPEDSSSNPSTQETIKKTPLRNFSYEAAMEQDQLERTSPELVDSLETVEEEDKPMSMVQAIISTPTPPTEEDEELAVEITTTKDALDGNEVINEIRFINNGIDVTNKVEQQQPDTPLAASLEELALEKVEQVEQQLMEPAQQQLEAAAQASDNLGDKLEAKLLETRESVQTAMRKAATGARDAVDTMGENAKRMATGARGAVDAVGDRMAAGARDAREAVDAAGENAKRMASGAVTAMEQAGSSAAKAAVETKESMGKAMDSVSSKISNEMHGAKENISQLFHIKAAKEANRQIAPPSTPDEDLDSSARERTKTSEGEDQEEEDERTTASVNSNHTSAGGNGKDQAQSHPNPNPFEDPYDALVERGKQAMREELSAMGERVQKQASIEQAEQSKGLMQKFLDGLRLNCRNEKAIQIEDEPPPPPQAAHASKNKVNSELSLHNGHAGEQQASRVCTIL